jgi:steroid delta-isomerase-like uncharacterized protein
MSVEENTAIVRRFYDEVWNRGNLGVADEVFAADYVRHDLRPTPVPQGPEGQKAVADGFRTGFPDIAMTIDFTVAEDDKVVARWTIRGTHTADWLGIPPTGRSVAFSGVNIFRLADGRVVEIWNYRDDLGLMQQLGAVPSPSPGTSEPR